MAAFGSHFEWILPQKVLGMPGRLRRTAPFGCRGNMELGGGINFRLAMWEIGQKIDQSTLAGVRVAWNWPSASFCPCGRMVDWSKNWPITLGRCGCSLKPSKLNNKCLVNGVSMKKNVSYHMKKLNLPGIEKLLGTFVSLGQTFWFLGRMFFLASLGKTTFSLGIKKFALGNQKFA